jgi:putative FmdB family regulatory protein
MPIYEYRCRDCGKRSSLLVLNVRNPPSLACTHCQGSRLERIMSRFAAPKSEEARLESLADPSRFGDVDEQDPRSMAQFMKNMGQEMGEDVGDDVEAALAESSGEEDGETAGTDME